MTKPKFSQGLYLVVIMIATAFMCVLANSKCNMKNVEFLKKYNWEVETAPIERVEFVIPEAFDEVYNNYNSLQKEAGLDLLPYAGYSAVRYTYIVKNFPLDIDEEVRANVICVDDIPVAGDISTVSIDGFMYSLNFNTQTCFSVSAMKIVG